MKNPIEGPKMQEKNGNLNQDQVENQAYDNRQRGNSKEERSRKQ